MSTPAFDADRALRLAHQTFDIEARALLGLKDRQGSAFAEVVKAILDCGGRVVVMGMGKSGHVGNKIAATLASTGTPSFFLHPAEAGHGDLGMVMAGDVVLAISNSGETDEVVALLPALKRLQVHAGGHHRPRWLHTGAPRQPCAVLGGRPGGLPAEPGAHRQHHRADGPWRRTGHGPVGRSRLPRSRLRAFAPGGSLGRKLLTTCAT